MARKQSQAALSKAERNNVRNWMKSHAHEHVDPTGALNHTGLAEAAARHFESPHWLGKETHWIWDLPFEVAEGVTVAENPVTKDDVLAFLLKQKTEVEKDIRKARRSGAADLLWVLDGLKSELSSIEAEIVRVRASTRANPRRNNPGTESASGLVGSLRF